MQLFDFQNKKLKMKIQFNFIRGKHQWWCSCVNFPQPT